MARSLKDRKRDLEFGLRICQRREQVGVTQMELARPASAWRLSPFSNRRSFRRAPISLSLSALCHCVVVIPPPSVTNPKSLCGSGCPFVDRIQSGVLLERGRKQPNAIASAHRSSIWRVLDA